MHALIVVAHPERTSLTQAIAARLAQGISRLDTGHTHEIADLAAEAFDPRETAEDLAVLRHNAPRPADVLREQARIDRADALLLVFPVYWWGMPALLKGWIDRVFTNGWAYDVKPEGGLLKLMRGRQVHLVGIGGADIGTYERHGYAQSIKTQIDHGIFDYCGADVVTSELLLDIDSGNVTPHLETARTIGGRLFPAA